ncbi:hypothetical protein GLP43_15855 [Sulfitobacter sp. M39]|uniref:hypothetical protein n=1 Tax=Sulfitobacter sp. M39 TaxID=2675334 RepID=UPI001F1D7101|nr:hypothetical protein [Sulfitobacter sp. M39]MCF7749030.1 hypothetical protein [Sulfitobacter sp. M39]
MARTNGSIQGRTDETEIAETVATTLENPIDFVVTLGDNGISRSAVDRIVSRVSGDIPVHLFFVEDLTQSDLKAFLGT